MHRHSARGLFDSVILPTFPPASAQFLPPPSSRLPLLPCRCYHSSSSHINYIPLPLSKPGPELLLTSIPLELPPMFVACDLADWQVNEYSCHGGLGVDCLASSSYYHKAWSSQASVVNAVHSYTNSWVKRINHPWGQEGSQRGVWLSADRKVTCPSFKKDGFPM